MRDLSLWPRRTRRAQSNERIKFDRTIELERSTCFLGNGRIRWRSKAYRHREISWNLFDDQKNSTSDGWKYCSTDDMQIVCLSHKIQELRVKRERLQMFSSVTLFHIDILERKSLEIRASDNFLLSLALREILGEKIVCWCLAEFYDFLLVSFAIEIRKVEQDPSNDARTV